MLGGIKAWAGRHEPKRLQQASTKLAGRQPQGWQRKAGTKAGRQTGLTARLAAGRTARLEEAAASLPSKAGHKVQAACGKGHGSCVNPIRHVRSFLCEMAGRCFAAASSYPRGLRNAFLPHAQLTLGIRWLRSDRFIRCASACIRCIRSTVALTLRSPVKPLRCCTPLSSTSSTGLPLPPSAFHLPCVLLRVRSFPCYPLQLCKFFAL
uniref:Uncharacterized protein n=1 Tax=Laticauda laticaudata TaxID=8630 RepID=A0A8C5SMV8_LATLA